ncbi:hypothetical protein SAMN05216565_12147 [Litchfieldia salsa]|uniref:Uncharacterized protein n=1 Tax=Litchfieldia salsa TaxID=930152 RepID=A0A1H0X0E4_9BACI|nr:hypothetical protein SAMN05216565_12147 [Litchfieldia salsa]
MTELSRSEKINLLKIKNKRKAIIKDFEERNISLTLNSFCDINYSINL